MDSDSVRRMISRGIRAEVERRAALAELRHVFRESQVSGWDGYGAARGIEDAFQHAEAFIRDLGAEFSVPDVGVDPDGEPSLDWFGEGSDIVSLSFAPDGTIRYASIIGGRRSYGSEPGGGGAPERIRAFLLELA